MKRQILFIMVFGLALVVLAGCSGRTPIHGSWSSLEEARPTQGVDLSRFALFSFEPGNKLSLLTQQTAIVYFGYREIGQGKGAQMYGTYQVTGKDIICVIHSAKVEWGRPNGIPQRIDRKRKLNLVVDYGWKLRPGGTLELTEKSVSDELTGLVFPVGTTMNLTKD